MASFEVEISGPIKDLHSGTFGGMIFEPMTDLVRLMSSLVDSHGRILIPGIYSDVQGLFATERCVYILDFLIAPDWEFPDPCTKPCTTRLQISKK